MTAVQLIRGQRLPLAAGLATVHAGLSAQGVLLDVVCFGVDAAGKLAGEPWMIFFNQPAGPCGGIQLRCCPCGHTQN